MSSLLLPSFLTRLADPEIRNVLLCGCGGGFDFVHALLLFPELQRLGKRVVIGSNSFGQPTDIDGGTTVFDVDGVVAKRVNARCRAPRHYGPEVHICAFLDERDAAGAPHEVYAWYARAFTVPLLRQLYEQLIAEHDIDAVVLVDGGSDALMAGDEEGLGDPIEDAVSVATVASLPGLMAKLLLTVGLGSDRFNHVSDAASLRAVAELTDRGAFLGAVGIEPGSEGFELYASCLAHVDARQSFRSVLASNIRAAVRGGFGPAGSAARATDSIFLWPLMAMVFAFDVDRVAERSLMVRWLRECATVLDCHLAVERGRRDLGDRLRPVEELPLHSEWRGRHEHPWRRGGR